MWGGVRVALSRSSSPEGCGCAVRREEAPRRAQPGWYKQGLPSAWQGSLIFKVAGTLPSAHCKLNLSYHTSSIDTVSCGGLLEVGKIATSTLSIIRILPVSNKMFTFCLLPVHLEDERKIRSWFLFATVTTNRFPKWSCCQKGEIQTSTSLSSLKTTEHSCMVVCT